LLHEAVSAALVGIVGFQRVTELDDELTDVTGIVSAAAMGSANTRRTSMSSGTRTGSIGSLIRPMA
jgi:hypothetical protein